MAVKKKEPRRLHSPVRARSAQAAEHAAQLAPPEEQREDQHSSTGGTIRVDTGPLKMPKAINGDDEAGPRLFGHDPVVLLILCVALAFIAFIAYLISIEPSP